jgi:hypothetical protein
MISPGNVTEFNVNGVLYAPHDDGSFAIPEAMVGEAMKANLTVRELTIVQLMQRVADAIQALPDGQYKSVLTRAFGSLVTDA